jgi:hypothetical protein
MHKIIILIILLFSNSIFASSINWSNLDQLFDTKVSLPSEFRDRVSYLNENNFYLYCYNETVYITNTEKKEDLRFISPLIGKFKYKKSYYYEYYNCNITASNINLYILDYDKDVVCINDIAYQHIENGLYPFFKYERYLRTKVGKPLNCKDYTPIKREYIAEIDKGVYCINNFVYFKNKDVKNILPLHTELLIETRESKTKSYKFNYSDKIHPLFCQSNSLDDYEKSKNLISSDTINNFYIEHGKKYKILKINKDKYLIPIINNIKLPISYERPKFINLNEGLN